MSSGKSYRTDDPKMLSILDNMTIISKEFGIAGVFFFFPWAIHLIPKKWIETPVLLNTFQKILDTIKASGMLNQTL